VSSPRRAGEVRLLDCLHDARNELRELMQHWDNRLTLENLSLAEQYREGRLSVALECKLAGHPHYIQFSALTDGERAIGERHHTSRSRDVRQGRDGNNRNTSEVFVGYVQTVQDPDGITIPSFVRLYDVPNQGNEIGTSSLYFSALKGGYQFVAGLPHRELDVVGRTVRVVHDFEGYVIKNRSQVVEGVSENGGNIYRQQLGLLKLQKVTSSLRILLDVKTAKVRLEEDVKLSLQLLDVLIGPFDL